ncbi:Bardet-Biedl syndrome 12 protein isoform X2 [Rhinatrema bivittatum]|nr:Bardet-Biedl syndrome 12 protein isoform X2 [Rhinatrema bivittatum]
MNKTSHIGLQQLSSLATSGTTFLGPVKFSKFIVDESTHETTLTCSTFRLLESLNFTDAVGQLLYETIQTQNKVYKTGTTTLLFLVGAWSNAVLECLHQGIPISLIASVMAEGLNSCIEEVKSLQIPLPNIHEKSDHESKDLGSKPGDSTSCSSMRSQNNVYLLHKEHISETDYLQQNNIVNFEKKNSKCCTSTADSFEPEYKLSHQISGCSFLSNKVKLTHSIHLNRLEKSQSSWEDNSQDYTVDPADVLTEGNDLGRLAAALSHGNQRSMKLVEDAIACMHQNMDNMSIAKFDTAGIVTCCLPGLSASLSCACSGYITLVSVENVTVVKHLQDRPLRCLLLEGDLTEKYRHVGFNRTSNVMMVSDHLDMPGSSSEGIWINKTINMLSELKIHLILVKGSVSESLMQQCIPKNILIVSQVNHNVLQAFCEVTGAIPVTYLTQVTMCCVGTGACVSMWKTVKLSTVHSGHGLVINIKAPRISLVTAVLSNALTTKIQAMEDEFWTCAYRLYHAIIDQKVFIGGGAVELLCLSHLQKLEKLSLKQDDKMSVRQIHHSSSWLARCSEHYKPSILRAMANGWVKYISTVMCNSAKCRSELESRALIQHHLQKMSDCSSPEAYLLKEYAKDIADLDFASKCEDTFEIYDNVTPKLEAWRRALDLTMLVLQTDAEILTGSWTLKQLKNSERSANEFILL